jgi:hypothetical protein
MILIDYNGIAIGTIVMEKLAVEENLIRHVILNRIRMYRKKFFQQYGEVVVVADSKRNWRYDVYPQYKFKRKDARKESAIDWQEVFRITNLVREELADNFPYKMLQVEGCEADDIISTLVENTQEFGNYEPVMIVSSDKDFVQLQRFDNVKQFSPSLKKFYTENNPRAQLAELILKGDQADGIPNVLSADNCFTDGIRQTTLRQKAIDQLLEDPKSMGDEIYRNYMRNKKLIDLSETPGHLKQEIINKFIDQGDKKENRKKVMGFLIEKNCRQLLDDIGDFV